MGVESETHAVVFPAWMLATTPVRLFISLPYKAQTSSVPFILPYIYGWCCCSVTQSCWSLCNPMNYSTPGFLVLHHLPEFAQTHIHWVGEAIQPISSSVIPFSSCPQSFPAPGCFLISQLFTSGRQSIGVSASTSILPMNTQDCSPLRWTGWISLQSKGLSRVFSNTAVQKHQFFGNACIWNLERW